MRRGFIPAVIAGGVLVAVAAIATLSAGAHTVAAVLVLALLLELLLVGLWAGRRAGRVSRQVRDLRRDLKATSRASVLPTPSVASNDTGTALGDVARFLRAEAVRRDSDQLALLDAVRAVGRSIAQLEASSLTATASAATSKDADDSTRY